MADKPQDTKHIVMSVPHSGTRTLQTYLSENRPEILRDEQDQVGHWHFSLHAGYCKQYFELGHGMAYIPIRNPYDVIDSWNRRYGPAPDKQVENCIGPAIELMTSCIDKHPDLVEPFKMEELPVIRGIGPNPDGWDKANTLKSQRLVDLKHWIQRTPMVDAFYRKYYTSEELWWL